MAALAAVALMVALVATALTVLCCFSVGSGGLDNGTGVALVMLVVGEFPDCRLHTS